MPASVDGYQGLPIVLGAIGFIQKKAQSSCRRVLFTLVTFELPIEEEVTAVPAAETFKFMPDRSPTAAGVVSDQRLSAWPTVPNIMAGTLPSSGPKVKYDVSGMIAYCIQGADPAVAAMAGLLQIKVS
jgi:hypothetical protein